MASKNPMSGHPHGARSIVAADEATIRFAGDAGDGMQLVGMQFAAASSQVGNAVCTIPDFPSEIRAPSGSLAGVAGFQVHFSSHIQHTPGDILSALVAMNPAALKTHLKDLAPAGLLIVNADAFTTEDLGHAGYAQSPLEDGSLGAYRLIAVPMLQLTREAVAKVSLTAREVDRCRNFFALGLAFWLYDRPLDPTLRWIREKYGKNPAMIEANTRTLTAGYHWADAAAPALPRCRVGKAALPPGRYRSLNGIEALAAGLHAASHQTKLPLVFSSFLLAPSSELLHQMCAEKQGNVKVMQAEDDLAALQIALGAAFGGAVGVTATSGPGLSLQSEGLGLAVMSELPCVIIDLQRAGPATGMPSKTEQGDLLQALHGRHGECPLPVLACATPADGFAVVLEAVRLAIRYMTPVVVLSDTYLAHASEPWRIPDVAALPRINVQQASPGASGFLPYQRDDHLARSWAVPGTAGLEHRTGGLEKENPSGAVNYDPANHEWMVQTRAKKIAGIADDIPLLVADGPEHADLLVVGWGSTFGTTQSAVERCRRKGLAVAHAHLRYLHPMPKNTGELLRRYPKILVPELNNGQMCQVLRAQYLVEPISLTKVRGQPFKVSEIERKIEELTSPPGIGVPHPGA